MHIDSFTDVKSTETLDILGRFNQVFLRRDPSDLVNLIGEECVIENTSPAPDGSRHVGKEACVALWTQIATMKDAHFEPEDIVARGDFGVIRWRLVWGDAPDQSVRGVNLMRVRDGRIVEALGYVKGG